MSEVRLYHHNKEFVVEAKGHATGSVEMCAAISTLMQTLDEWLRVSGAAVKERVIDFGHCKLRFSGIGCRTAYDVITVGFLGLQESDPEHIHVDLRNA